MSGMSRHAMRAEERHAADDDRAADAGAHADRQEDTGATPRAVMRFAKPMRDDVADHMHRQIGDRAERIVDPLAFPSGEQIRRGDDLAGLAVGHTGGRDADAARLYALGACAVELTARGRDDALAHGVASLRGVCRLLIAQ